MTAIRKAGDTVKLSAILALVVVFFTSLVWLTRRDLLLTIIFFFALLAAIVLITFYLIRRERRYLLQCGIADLDRMSARYFARFLQEIFQRQGFALRETVLVGNHGADLILERAGKLTVVQARRWKNNPGVRVVQEAVAAVAGHHAVKGIAVTNTHFTPKAVELAASHGIELWDRDKLIALMGERTS